MKFREAMVDVFRDLFSWLKGKGNKENIEFAVFLMGVLAFIFAPLIMPIFLLMFFKVKFGLYYLITAWFDVLWIFYAFKVITKWGE